MSEGDARAALASARLWGSDRVPLWPPLAGGCRPLPGPPATCICLARAGPFRSWEWSRPRLRVILPLPSPPRRLLPGARRKEKKKKKKSPPETNTSTYYGKKIFLSILILL